jgi:pyrroloquinoline quinone biosynthesis protein D
MSIDTDTRPRLARAATLRWDTVREKWVVQAPEYLFFPDDVAVSIIALCDGRRTLCSIVDELVGRFDAPLDVIQRDTIDLLETLSAEGVIVHDAPPA